MYTIGRSVNIIKTLLGVSCVVAFTATGYGQSAVNSDKPANKKDSASYAIGVNIGQRFKIDGVDVNAMMIGAGIRDAMAGKSLLSDEQLRTTISALQEENNRRANEKKAADGAENKKKGETFLADNKKQAGVMTTPSGLQYKVITEGKGAKPVATSQVKVHYEGKLIDGTVFDSSIKRGEPVTFPLNGVIKGWTEGLQLMPVGSKYMLYIPGDLAYGAQGAAGGKIGANETLIFEVELLEIVAPTK